MQKYEWSTDSYNFDWRNNYSEQTLTESLSKINKPWNKLRQVPNWDTSSFKYNDWEHARRLRSADLERSTTSPSPLADRNTRKRSKN